MNEMSEKLKRAWQKFLDALIEDDFNWSDYYNTDMEKGFREGLDIIHKSFKKEGVYDK